jgi:crossover junction endodeoxyribonuclease RusA
MLPFEFTVLGPPVSQQSHNRQRLQAWKALVRAAAAAKWPADTEPAKGAVRLVVTYYHDGPLPRLDGDNMAKPIQDALNGLVYVDDRQVTDQESHSRNLNGRFTVRHASMVLLQAFSVGDEFLHVQVLAVSEPQDLPR